jgi:hypothetical protein
MTIHIGDIIREKVKGSSLPVKVIAQKINRSENTLYDIYRRASIDTALLLKLCEILDFNFFVLYNESEPIKAMVESEVSKLQKKITELEEKILFQNEHIDSLKEIILAQKEAQKKSKGK